ncbi:MAG: transposase [Planctomycetaceae bacterium]|nr:transposase [Planctomycetaceae bacterium]
MAKHSTVEQWAAWVNEQQESERNVLEFCERIGGSPNSFYRWRQKLATKGKLPGRREPEAQRRSGTKELNSSSGPEFVPLTVLTSPVVEIDLPCGAVIWISNEDRSPRRVPGILLEARPAVEDCAIKEVAFWTHCRRYWHKAREEAGSRFSCAGRDRQTVPSENRDSRPVGCC